MAYQPHAYLQLAGTIAGTEQWTFGLRVGPIDDAQDSTWFDGRLDALSTAAQTFFASTSLNFPPSVELRSLKFNPVDALGHYRDATTHAVYYSAGQVKGPAQGRGVLPSECSLVATLDTDAHRGHAHAGRIYLPPQTLILEPDTFLLPAATAQAAADAVATFLHAVNQAVSVGMPANTFAPNVRIFSKIGTGASHPVTSVRVGRVVDAQRRRRRSLKEGYVVSQIAI